MVSVLGVWGEEKENRVALTDIGSGGCEFCSLLGSAGSEWRGDHVSSCKSLDVMSKQQASGSQRTPADCPCDKTRVEDQDGQPPEFTSRALLGSVKRCLQTGILCSNLCPIISLKIRKTISGLLHCLINTPGKLADMAWWECRMLSLNILVTVLGYQTDCLHQPLQDCLSQD